MWGLGKFGVTRLGVHVIFHFCRR